MFLVICATLKTNLRTRDIALTKNSSHDNTPNNMQEGNQDKPAAVEFIFIYGAASPVRTHE